ncbi:DinB family protein [Paenibacillus sp. XY044]|uniref:DinB family protein n=1 Tax=Paenibacillus sp. XY044 TaxID=2026089 RepID=UPI000B97E1FC|nr:DinB family protein [Paenibacillus sp. XY044]OZB94197.1 hypothetical protein CJP46_18480 [Paenibacillus sp. XY044]
MDDFVGKDELLRRLHHGYKEFNEGIKRLSPEQMETPGVNGKWSIKEVIAHFIAHEQFALTEIRYALAGKSYEPEETDINIFNEQAVTVRRNQSLEQIIQAWDASFRQVVTVIEELPESTFEPFGEFTRVLGDTVDGALGNNTYQHYAEHLSTIKNWISKIPKK